MYVPIRRVVFYPLEDRSNSLDLDDLHRGYIGGPRRGAFDLKL